jgi:rhamnogalacturonan endolyase
MIQYYSRIFLLLTIIFSGCSTVKYKDYEPVGFVTIPATQFMREGKKVSLDEFQICDHTVTNAEYRKFIDATDYPPPLHWKNGVVPSGKDNYPVIFVNRDDVAAYTKWLTAVSGRIYRLPLTMEFICTSSGTETRDDTAKFNFRYDSRSFDQWEKYLKPATWGNRNDHGLFNMAGNVWQLIDDNPDPQNLLWRYRIETLASSNRIIMGGSWYSDSEYLKYGSAFSQSPGIKYPDLGFRLVREPDGRSWSVVPRQVSAVTNSDGQITLSWAALKKDSATASFNIYRINGDRQNQSGIRINKSPVLNTSFTDTSEMVPGKRYQYRVREIDYSGKEGHPSEWTGVAASEGNNPVVVSFKPLFEKGGMIPVFGDLEGWNRKGCVIRLDNGNVEMSQDPGIPVQLEAFSSTGRSLWRKDIAWHRNIFGSASNAPFDVWDMDHDGKDEVITLLQIGEQNYAAILDGMSGNVLFKAPWTPMSTDLSLSSTRIQMSIAYLDGMNPSVITQTGIYENEIITAYDNRMNKLWDYKSFMETNGSGGHKIEVADVNGDGRQEVIYGTTCLNPDGTMRWSIYRQHPDLISIHDYIPEREGLEVFYIIESSVNAGVYMVDANSGEMIWKNNREDDPVWSHGHIGWTADIWDGSKGMEAVSNRAGHDDKTLLLFSSDGRRMMDSFPLGYTPMEWDGDDTRELLGDNGKVIGDFNGSEIILSPEVIPNPLKDTKLIFTADLYGDFRSEMVVSGKDTDGRSMVMVVTATEPVDRSFVAPSEELDYRLWLSRNKGGGYGQVYEYVLVKPE